MPTEEITKILSCIGKEVHYTYPGSFDWFVTNQPQIRLESVQLREWFPAYVGQCWFIPWLLLRVSHHRS
jgi:hypothetical protein